MKTKLYDFSVSTAVVVCLAYLFLLSFLGFTWYDSHSAVSAVVFILLLLSFFTVVVFFVFLAPEIDGKKIKHGDKIIYLKELKYKAIYDERFKEKTVVFWNRSTQIQYLSKKEYYKKTIRVQATKANIKKIESWTGDSITVPEKPQRKNPFRKR